MAVAMPMLTLPSATAAVRVCAERLTSGPQLAATEAEARAAAIKAWRARSARGPDQTLPAWRIATSRTLACRPVDDGTFACEAAARPCVIRQKAHDGATPLPRAPKPKGPAIEI
jgi:hypothetical protein